MSLAHLNRCFQRWSLTLSGRFVLLLLVAALLPGTRLAVEHAHADGGHVHAHADEPAPDQDGAPEVAEPGEVQLHQHDTGTAASDLPPANSLQAASISPDHLVKGLAASAPAASPRAPPHRPPIA